ncbi:hypothetical protein F5X96DRAFT_133466 [Biscogniauxia mediterranea]|nr:hypothetical protein F5X96DRAFT_133466 [Biscogniauxia mediterranea]
MRALHISILFREFAMASSASAGPSSPIRVTPNTIVRIVHFNSRCPGCGDGSDDSSSMLCGRVHAECVGVRGEGSMVDREDVFSNTIM